MTRRTASTLLWLAALLIAIGLGSFQRLTGPTYPRRGAVELAGETVHYRLPRSHGGREGLAVSVEASTVVAGGSLFWRRYPTDGPWLEEPMTRMADGRIWAEIPHQPPAGKVEYWLELEAAADNVLVAADAPVIARFRGDVPATVLIPHILAMFTSMLLATRALLEVLRPEAPRARRLILGSMLLLLVGGLLLGPLVQRYAFGVYWTGWPFGIDLTDNKTLAAVAAWLPATVLAVRKSRTRIAVVLGWLVMMGVFLIPHSLLGSELDWSTQAPDGRRSTGAPQ